MKIEKKHVELDFVAGEITAQKVEIKQLQYALDAAQAELKLAILEMDVLEKIM